MSDLLYAFGVLGVVDVLLFGAGVRLGRARSVGAAQGIGFLAGVGALAAWWWLRDELRLASLIPVSSLIVLGNGTPAIAGFLSGLAWSLIPRHPGPRLAAPWAVQARRVVFVLALHGVGWTAVVRPMWGSPPPCRDRWDGDLCLQTSDVTCSAACAATLLRDRGISATEAEMADLCLTRRDGTLWLGLYRGLKRKTAGTAWDVAVVRGGFDALRRPGLGPAILAAGLPKDARVARIYTEQFGWEPGQWHSVLFFGFAPGGRVRMGDPTPGIGREEWTEADLRTLWEGVGLTLVPRAGRATGPPELHRRIAPLTLGRGG